ncbi:MAG: reverse transcriptase domain-containing protein, partial [Chryseobacterium sp.]
MSKLYRICLDFRELNTVLQFPNQTAFTTVDEILMKLKGKKVVSLDISSAFFIIPIKEEDRHKTAFWVNHDAFEFCAAVMGLKSSPYHLACFMKKAFSQAVFDEIKSSLPTEEQDLLPTSFAQMLIAYFDDIFLYRDTYEELYVAMKVLLKASAFAKIKYSSEKSKFFTTNIKVLGYNFDTMAEQLTMDKVKASGILNIKKPSSLYELHSRLASFQYQSMFLPYLKHILYPLNFLLKKKEFKWGQIEERAWQTARSLCALNLRLTIPNETDELVLTTDASKIAAAACLFRVKNGQLELVSTSSKYFSTADLGKCSYILESISLAYALKVFSPYLLNCESRITIYTDARALIYAKRMSTHSILLNSTLNYLTTFVSVLNVHLVHIPGSINVLADVLSRAISDNLNCDMPKEHPISRIWAQVLPPLPENYGISHDVLLQFLTKPLKPEPQDLHDRTHRKLNEPKSVEDIYNLSSLQTAEQTFHSIQVTLKQWLSEYATVAFRSEKQAQLLQLKVAIDIKKHQVVLEKIKQLMEKSYETLKKTPLYKTIQKNLKHYLEYLVNNNSDLAQAFNLSLEKLVTTLGLEATEELYSEVDSQLADEYATSLNMMRYESVSQDLSPVVYFHLKETADLSPKICVESNGLDIPLQQDETFQPYELRKIDLQIRFQFPKHHCALLMNKSSARPKYNVHVQLGLIDIGYHDYVATIIQNMSDQPITL